MVAAAVLLVGASTAAFAAVGEYGRQREQRRDYVAVPGRVVTADGGPAFAGSAAPFGDVKVALRRVAVPPGTTTLLVARDDPADYLRPARPGPPAARAARRAAAGLALAALAGVLHRRRPLDLSGVRAYATPLPDDGAPPPEPGPVPPEPWRPLVWAAVFVVFAVGFAVDAAEPTVRTRRLAGQVTAGDRVWAAGGGVLVDRPLTGAERARGLRPGDRLEVTARVHRAVHAGDEHPVALAAVALVYAVAAAGAVARWVARPRLLRRLLATPPHRVDAVAWSRRPGGKDWLFVAPADATRVGEVVAFRLRKGVRPPPAMAGPLWVHGRPGRWRHAVVRGPGGETYWPAGRSPGWVSAAVASAGPAAPVPPPDRAGQPGA